MPLRVGGTFRGVSTSSITNKTLGQIKVAVSRVIGAQDRPDEVGALDAIHAAIDTINETNWEWTLTFERITTVVGTANYALPLTTKSIQSAMIVSSNQRKLQPIRADVYERAYWNQTDNGMSLYYSLRNMGQLRKLTLHPPPGAAETLDVWYYRDLSKPTDANAIPAWPAFLERAIILQAQVLVSLWRGTHSDRVAQLAALAEDALRGAKMRDRDWHDEDPQLISLNQAAPAWPWDHPMRSE